MRTSTWFLSYFSTIRRSVCMHYTYIQTSKIHTHTHTHTQSEHMHTGLFHFHCRRSKGTYQTHRNQQDTAQMHPAAGLICNAGFPTVLTFDEVKQSMTMSGTKIMPADATFAQVVDFTRECARAPSFTSLHSRARSIPLSHGLSLASTPSSLSVLACLARASAPCVIVVRGCAMFSAQIAARTC